MRSAIIIYIISIFGFGSVSSQVEYEAVESSLIEAIAEVERKHNVRFSYDVDAVERYSANVPRGVFTLQGILEKLLAGTQLSYEFIDGSNVLITPKKYEHALSHLCGYILDHVTREPIPFASVYNDTQTKGVETNESGYFAIEVDQYDRSIYISYLGYQTLEIMLENDFGVDCEDYLLITENINFSPIILTEYLSDGISQSKNGNTVRVQPGEMDLLPGTVEQDVLSSIQFLPGIISADETLDGLSVRGGTPDQNLVLWDGIPMYHTSHFFGSISAFNPFIIDHVDVYRSGISSEYGGRVSSVIDISSTSEITDDLELAAGINLTHTYANANIPLWKGSSLVISTRRSITDIWNTPTFIQYANKVFQGTKLDNAEFNSGNLPFDDEFRFNDGNFKWMWEVGKNKFTVSTIGAVNRLNYRAEIPALNAFSVDFLNLRNGGVDISWERNWSSKFKSNIDITSADYTYDYNLSFRLLDAENEPPPISFDTKNRIRDDGLLWTNDFQINKDQRVQFGYQFTENIIDLSYKNDDRGNITEDGESFINGLHALFGEYSLSIPERLHLDIGLRYQYSQEIKNNYFEPRISLITDVAPTFKLKLSTSKHFQFISQLVAFNINQLGLNNQIWVASNNKEIPVIESNQWMGGFIFKKDKWTLDVEGYVKELDGITTLTNNFVSLPEQPPFSVGKSRIRGIDVLLKRRIKRYNTWLSYTLSQSLYDFRLLSSEAVPATHDQTHVIQWVHTYKYGAWDFSLGWQRRSGLPTTLAKGVTTRINENGESVPTIEYDVVNGARLPAYRKLDASIVYNFGDKSKFHGFIGLSFQNILNKNNVVAKQYLLGEQDSNGTPELVEIDKLGLKFTPNVSVNLRY